MLRSPEPSVALSDELESSDFEKYVTSTSDDTPDLSSQSSVYNDGYGGVEPPMWTQHLSGPSCNSVSKDDRGNDGIDGRMEEPSVASAAQPEPVPSETYSNDSENFDKILDDEIDDEEAGKILEEHDTPKKPPPLSLKRRATPPASKLTTATRVSSAKRRKKGAKTALFSSNQDSSNQNTLTQMFRSPCSAEEEDSALKEETKARDVENEDMMYAGWGRIKKMVKKDEVWGISDESLKGYRFKLGKLGTNPQTMQNEASCDDVRISMEKTFIGPEEAKRLKEKCGWEHEWARLVNGGDPLTSDGKKLFCDGKIPLKIFLNSERDTTISSNPPSLVFEKEPNGKRHTWAYYYRLDDNPAEQHVHCDRTLSIPVKCDEQQHRRKPVALDLFAGCGGMSLGLEAAGFDVKYKVDKNMTARDTLYLNFGGDKLVFREDVLLFLEKCKQRKDVYPQRGDVDHLNACPPCQGHSTVNTSGGANDLQNNECTLHFVKVVDFFRPRTVVMENVPGIMQKKSVGRYVQPVVSELLRMGYQVRLCYLKSSDYGDPQNRLRVVLLAAQKGYDLPASPVPTHGGEGRKRLVTAKDAIGFLEDVEPVPDTGLVSANGKVLGNHYSEKTNLKETKDDAYCLNANEPANTVRNSNYMQHYTKKRYITILERALLQSFPADYRFAGTRNDAWKQIGNAVPVQMATAIGKSAMKCYGG